MFTPYSTRMYETMKKKSSKYDPEKLNRVGTKLNNSKV